MSCIKRTKRSFLRLDDSTNLPGLDEYAQIHIHCVHKNYHEVTIITKNDPDFTIPVQQLCSNLLRTYFPEKDINPTVEQLFGLAYFDRSQNTCIWLNPKKSLKSLQEIKRSDFRILDHLSLRIRFLPIKSKIEAQFLQALTKTTSHNDVSFLTQYLYLQWQHDFVTDKLHNFFSETVPSGKARGIAVLDLLIMARLKKIEPPELIFDKIKSLYHRNNEKRDNFWHCYHVLPSRERANFWKQYKLRENMKSKLINYSNEYPKESVTCNDLMMQYIREMMVEVTERYSAMEAHNDKKVEVTINMTDGCGVYVREVSDHDHSRRLVSTIGELQCVSMHSVNYGNDRKWNVHIDHANGVPKVLCFDSQEVAESFVSGLDGYYRLIQNYYSSLCDLVEPLSVRELYKLRCHGPIENSFAVQKLKKSYSEQEYYILKQDVHERDKYAIVFSSHGQIRIKTIKKEEEKFMFEDDATLKVEDMNILLKSLSDGQTLPRNAIRVRPTEYCEVFRNLFVSIKEIDTVDDEDHAILLKKRQPLVYLQSDVTVFTEERLGAGYFTEVYKGKIKAIDKLIAIKQIRQHRQVEKNQEFRCYESLQIGACHQLGFDDIRFFIGIHGICLTSPPQVIEEYAQYGSLTKFFTLKKTFTLQHFMFVAIQLAEALLYMDEKKLCHGGICCKNILVFKYDGGDIHVKLADTGMLYIYNQLPIGHYLNLQRLPWIAPELFNNFSKATIESDVYAFSTTLWECFNQGRNPLTIEPLKGFGTDSTKIVEFYEKGNKIDFPEDLKVKEKKDEEDNSDIAVKSSEYQHGNNDHYNVKVNKIKNVVTGIMTECWNQSETRIETNAILKALRTVHSDYMSTEYYRQYSKIPEELDSFTCNSTTGDSDQSQTNEIPHIIQFLDKGGHDRQITAEDFHLTVNLPTNNGRTVMHEHRAKPRVKMNEVIGINFLIDSKRLELNSGTIGFGHYGEVKKGTLYTTVSRDSASPGQIIAAKILKSDQFKGVLDSEEFRHEAELMSKLAHENIVKFIGVSDNMLIMEWVEKGCMRDYLRNKKKNNSPESSKKILEICTDISAGMAYLASMKILHCDLASRNVLLSSKLRAKISDFGLAKILDKEKDYYRRSNGKQLPAWWCSPEALGYRKFSTKSDVWSYGIVMWEGFTHSEAPKLTKHYSQLLTSIEKGKRLQKPHKCPDAIYLLMKKCWQIRPDDRPDFNQIENECRELWKQFEEECKSSELTKESPCSSDDQQQSALKANDVQSDSLSQKTDSNNETGNVSQEGMTATITQTRGDVKHENITESNNVGKENKIVQDTVNTVSRNVQPTHTGKEAVNTGSTGTQTVLGQTTVHNTGSESSKPVIGQMTAHETGNESSKSELGQTTAHNFAVTHKSTSVLKMNTVTNCTVESNHNLNTTTDPALFMFKEVVSINRTTNKSGEHDLQQRSPPTVSGVVGMPLPPVPCKLNYLLEEKQVEYDNREQPLGAGNFGIVYKGKLSRGQRSIDVAIKTLREDSVSKDGKDEIESEVIILGELEHPNIVKFYGFCRTSSLLVMELIDDGCNLLKYLQKCRSEKKLISNKQRIQFSLDISKGMEYLANKRVIHCDLAARNVLLTKHLQTKISDFGLSKLLQENNYYKRSGSKMMNILWCAPEFVLTRKLSIKSDVWSFGIVMWEIFSDGIEPSILKEVEDLLKQLEVYIIQKGWRLLKPETCSEHVYSVMQNCWKLEPEQRPTFSDLVLRLQTLFEDCNN